LEELYKKHIIVVTTRRRSHKFKWKPTCTILAAHSRKILMSLKWDLDYETREQAQRVGLLISKKWIDETKPDQN
jgi:hypothetical protein